MAKIVLDSSPPDAEIDTALKRIDHLLSIARKDRNSMTVAILVEERKFLRLAYAQNELLKRRLAARCREIAGYPPSLKLVGSDDDGKRVNQGRAVQACSPVRIEPQGGDGLDA